jgi:hypothetical protein
MNSPGVWAGLSVMPPTRFVLVIKLEWNLCIDPRCLLCSPRKRRDDPDR